jgi:hypothetical protein
VVAFASKLAELSSSCSRTTVRPNSPPRLLTAATIACASASGFPGFKEMPSACNAELAPWSVISPRYTFLASHPTPVVGIALDAALPPVPVVVLVTVVPLVLVVPPVLPIPEVPLPAWFAPEPVPVGRVVLVVEATPEEWLDRLAFPVLEPDNDWRLPLALRICAGVKVVPQPATTIARMNMAGTRIRRRDLAGGGVFKVTIPPVNQDGRTTQIL